VWNVARTAQQILDNFNKQLQGNEANLQAYWTFNAGNANDLTPKGEQRILERRGKHYQSRRPRPQVGPASAALHSLPRQRQTSSAISWVQAAAAGTSVKIETSLDNGVTFQTAVSGGAIPASPAAMN
jgi:hypothetical protein